MPKFLRLGWEHILFTGEHRRPRLLHAKGVILPPAGVDPDPGHASCFFMTALTAQQTRRILMYTTIWIYNQDNMEMGMGTVPEFYIGSPVESVDLRFRGEIVGKSCGKPCAPATWCSTAPRRNRQDQRHGPLA